MSDKTVAEQMQEELGKGFRDETLIVPRKDMEEWIKQIEEEKDETYQRGQEYETPEDWYSIVP